jgi:hypothetical protein
VVGEQAEQVFQDRLRGGSERALTEQLPMAHAPEVAKFPPLLRAITRLGARSETVTRHADRVVHYRFYNGDLT